MQIGPYTIERELGRGGMGTVYLARAHGEPPVALKVINPRLAGDPQIAARFRAEGEALERLSHPNLVGLRARGSAPQGLWLAMDYVAGQTLDERLKTTGPLSSPEAGELLLALSGALSHAHAAGVLHRDLKPSNVLLREGDGRPLVLDFGLALPLDVSQHLTQTGEILGSPGYLAPEQCGSKGETSARTDVYGLGALLYATLTGRPPFQSSTLLGTLDAVLHAPARDPRELNPSVDPALAQLSLRCLAKDPSERLESASELARALQDEEQRSSRSPRGGLVLAGALLCGATLALGSLASSFLDTSPVPTTSASPSLGPSATPAPSRPAQTAATRTARAALEVQDWPAAHLALVKVESLEGVWLSYLALIGELRAKGQAAPGWRELRSAAVARAQREAESAAPERAWALALSGMLQAIRYPFATDPPLQEQEHADLLARLEAARHSPTLSHEQRRELARATAQCQLRRLARTKDPVVLRRAEEACERWRELGADSWTLNLAMADIWIVLERFDQANLTLDQAERDAADERPWERLVTYYVREMLTQAEAEATPPTQLQLSRTILTSPHSPPLLKARVAAYYSRALVNAGRWQEAILTLEAHAPELDEGLAAAHYEAKAYALSRGGDFRAARDLLLGVEGPLRSPSSKALLGLTHLRLGESERGATALRGLARVVQGHSGRLLLLEATVLAGDAARWRELLGGLTSSADLLLTLRAQEALERALRARGPKGQPVAPDPESVRRAVAELRAHFSKRPEALVERLLEHGRWRRALRWIQEELGEGAAKPQPELATRLAFRALERGRDEETTPGQEWLELRRSVTRFAEQNLPRSPLGRGLLALLELSGDPPPERLAELETVFAEALAVASWEELFEARLRALSLHLVLSGAPPGERQAQTAAAVTAWSRAHPQSPSALHTHFQHVPLQSPDELLDALARQDRDREVSLLAARNKALIRLQRKESSPAQAAERLSFLALDRISLAAQRRELLVQATELWLTVPGYSREALSVLARVEAWCGPTPPDQLARFELARSRAFAGLPDQLPQAIAVARRALAATGESHWRRASILAHLGRVECDLGQREAGLAHLQQALTLTPSQEVWLQFARVSSGEERRRCYLQALGLPGPPGALLPLLQEIRGEGLDPGLLCSEAFRLLEARGRAPVAMNLAQPIFAFRPDAASAKLVCQAYLVAAMMTPEALPDLARFRPLLGRAEPLLERKARELFDALIALLDARARAPQATSKSEAAARIATALELVQTRAQSSPQDAHAFRFRLAELSTYQHLAALVPAPQERERQRARARASLEAWVSEPNADLRAPSWLARLQSEDGEYEQALATLERALAGARDLPSQIGRLELSKAVMLSHLDRGSDALAALERSRRAGGALAAGPDAESLRAEIFLGLGDLEAASACLARGRARGFAIPPPVEFGLVLLEVRILIERGEHEEAQRKLKQIQSAPAQAGIGPRGRALLLTLGSYFLRRAGDLPAARRALERALTLAPTSGQARVAELDLVSAESGREAALRRAKELITLEGLSPRAHRLLRERTAKLEAAPEGE
jgi:serine/threonine protein kinase/tetratricopeptide (TPR) repeat protein